MRISDEVTRCVVFISRMEVIDQEDGQTRREWTDYRGTGFIVSMPYAGTLGCLHLVTAKHVALAVSKGDACFGINAKDGLVRWMVSSDTPWFYHPTDPSVDVAVMPMASANIAAYRYASVPIEMFVSEDDLDRGVYGLGDEVATTGLFKPFPGDNSLLQPIVRMGNISMLAKGRLAHPQYGSIEAHLVEGRSIGGLSGSPVFTRQTIAMGVMDTLGQELKLNGLSSVAKLFGLVSGHWDIPASFDQPESRPINAGISIVVPSSKILEVLYGPELTAMREEAFHRMVPGFETTDDSDLNIK